MRSLMSFHLIPEQRKVKTLKKEDLKILLFLFILFEVPVVVP